MLRRLVQAKTFRVLLFVAAVVAFALIALQGMSNRVDANHASFVEESVRRSAVQCYAIEGRFPSNAEGVEYLEENYGLNIDYSHFVVYYESMGDNLIPQIRVIPVSQD
ncbi:MAG: hypothetical protein LBS98_06345 [Coriobacteriales bacterium]|nr:hypothetical protein [Coriobacteriales bacterium]